MNKRIFFLATILSLITLCTFGQNAKKYYKAGNTFFKSLKYEDAAAQFTSAIGLEPSNPDYYFARGKTYEMLIKYSEARTDYEKCLVFSPKNVNALLGLGKVCNKLGDFKGALAHLNRASALDKRNSQVYPEKVLTLMGLERYDQALKVSDTAVIIKPNNAMNYYYRGIIYLKLNNELFGKRELEKAISKDRKLPEPRLALAELLISGNPQEALAQCNEVLKHNDRSTAAYLMRSKVYRANYDYPNAINDISKDILIEPNNPDFYLYRGECYQAFNQHTNAINDYSRYITLNPNNPTAYFARAKSYEEIMNYAKAMEDYTKITVLSEFNQEARKRLKEAQDRMYELNRETVPPEISVISPAPVDNFIEIPGDKTNFLISGKIRDKSKVKSLAINNEPVAMTEKNGEYEFLTNVDVKNLDKITLAALDDYDNKKEQNYSLRRTEINPPKITVLAPYASDDGQIYLERNSLEKSSNDLILQGKINDESKIKSIFIDGVTASYAVGNLNPDFMVTVDILNKNKIVIEAEDIYGNRQVSEFRLNREGLALEENNPMGKTWVVFIENSNYSTFASLDGPVKDVNLMERAFANYQVHKIIHKQNMTKAEMERFFSLELRELIKANQVRSLLIWYAGHGKFINDVGYWIPVDAKRDDDFTYFNLNFLRASMEAYQNYLTHDLVVTDACESGPSFYQAMRADLKQRSCDNTNDTQYKSSQVFSSAGYELAVDDSQFTRTFASALTNNSKACIPIEDIVKKVNTAVGDNNQQRPKFGKILGLKDEDGTFFFIAK